MSDTPSKYELAQKWLAAKQAREQAGRAFEEARRGVDATQRELNNAEEALKKAAPQNEVLLVDGKAIVFGYDNNRWTFMVKSIG